MTHQPGHPCDISLWRQPQYAGIAVYLRASGLRDTAALVDAVGRLNVRTAFLVLRHATSGEGVDASHRIPAPVCAFADLHEAVLQLLSLLDADMRAVERVLGGSGPAVRTGRRELASHLQALGHAHRVVVQLDCGADSGTSEHLECRARHLKSVFEGRHGVTPPMPTPSSGALPRPRQPVIGQRARCAGRPRLAG